MSAQGTGPCLADSEDHFDSEGLCNCGCGDCTTRSAGICVCPECPCDPYDPEAPSHFGHVWLSG